MIVETEYNLTDADFERISDLVYKHCRINLHDGKQQLVRARIAKRLRQSGFATLPQYLDHVLADPGGREFTMFIDSMTTNLTSFYRESDHFRFLAETALPEVLERKRKQNDNRIRFWSAGCSSGEEPYTLAMTLLDSVKDAKSWDMKILATDLSTHVLGMAKRGVYEAERVEALPPAYKSRFCEPRALDGSRVYTMSQEIRSLIAFRHLNLMENWPFSGPFEFIFCRNVMIYFDKPTQERLVNRFHDLLAPGGILFTGHSESLTGVKHPFRYVRPTVYAKA